MRRCKKTATLAEVWRNDWTLVNVRCEAHTLKCPEWWHTVPIRDAAALQHRMIAIDMIQREIDCSLNSDTPVSKREALSDAIHILKSGLPTASQPLIIPYARSVDSRGLVTPSHIEKRQHPLCGIRFYRSPKICKNRATRAEVHAVYGNSATVRCDEHDFLGLRSAKWDYFASIEDAAEVQMRAMALGFLESENNYRLGSDAPVSQRAALREAMDWLLRKLSSYRR